MGDIVLWFPSSLGKRHPRCLVRSHGGGWQLLLSWGWWAPPGHGSGREGALGTSSGWNCKVFFVIILYLLFSIAGSCSSAQIVGIQGETASLACFPLPTALKSTNQHLFKNQITKKGKAKPQTHKPQTPEVSSCVVLPCREALQRLSAAMGFCELNVGKRCCAPVSSKALIAEC